MPPPGGIVSVHIIWNYAEEIGLFSPLIYSTIDL